MLLWISWFVASFITNTATFYIIDRYLLNKRFCYSFRYFYLTFIYATFSTIIILTSDGSTRLLFGYITATIFIFINYRFTLSKTVISMFLVYLAYAVSEILFAIIFSSILKLDLELTSTNFICIILSNIIIPVVAIFIFKIPKLSKLFRKCVMWYSNKKLINIVVIAVFSIISIFVFMNKNMSSNSNLDDYFINVIIGVYIIILVVITIKEITDKDKVTFDYDQLLTYVKAYEDMTEQKSKSQHEHNNQLSYIRGMVKAKDPDNEIISYIDKLLDKQKNIEDEKLLKEIRFLPGGLKGLVHYKVVNMKESKIDVTLYVADELKAKNNWELYKRYESEISHILGVYLDNAKEAASEAIKKYILIDVLCDNDNLMFSISNTYNGVIDTSKIDKPKYSTKGKNRGYGLSLVKDIINKTPHIEQSREIRGMYFIQNLIVKK